ALVDTCGKQSLTSRCAALAGSRSAEGMAMTFDHDWWYSGGFNRQLDLARECCAANRFPELRKGTPKPDTPATRYLNELETRSVVYLRDGFSYEIKELVNAGTTSY